MANYAAIADVSDTLVELLRDRITERSDVVNVDRTEVALVSPNDVGSDSDTRLALYLYGVTENDVMNDAQREPIGEDRFRDPPLALDLHYLLTAFPAQGGNDETARTEDQQRVLGLAMQVLNDHSIVPAEEVKGSPESDLHVTLEQEPLDEITNVYNTFQDTPLHPTITYTVSPVLIDSRREETIPRVERRESDVSRTSE